MRFTKAHVKKISLLCAELILVCFCIVLWNWVFHNPMCDFMFKCGCTWNWDGGWDNCNIHDPSAPHCPYCSAPPSTAWITQWGVMGSMFVAYYCAAYFGTIINFFKKSEGEGRKFECTVELNFVNVTSRIIAIPVAFFLSSIVVGLGFYLSAEDYPSFLIH